MQIDILDKQTVHQILFEINSYQNKSRKEKEWDAYQIKEGLVREYVKAQLKTLFPKNHLKMRISDVNIAKKVIDKLAKAYSLPPQRLIPGASQDVNSSLNQIYKDGEFNCAFRNFDWIYNLHRHALLWVNYDYSESEYEVSALKPFEYDIVRDPNDGHLLCVVLSYPDIEITTNGLKGNIPIEISDGINQLIQESQFDSGAEHKVFALWTPENHVVVIWSKKTTMLATGKKEYSYSVTYVPIDANPENVNPLGMLNFVYKQKSDSIDYPTSNPLAQQTINYNIFNSDILTAATMQGFGQAVFKYPEGSEIVEQEVGYMNAIKLPQSSMPDAKETSFEFQNASPNLEGWQKLILTYLKQVLAEHGITSSQAIDGENEQFTSGLDRMIAQADVQWIIQENQEAYLEVENDVFEIVKAYENLNGNFEFNDYDEIKVIYQKPTVQISDSDKLNNIKMLLDMGLTDKAGALMILDPNLSEEQAQEKIAKIESEGQLIRQAVSNLSQLNQGQQNQPQDMLDDGQDTQSNL